MANTLGDIIKIIEDVIPQNLSETWDNCGLQVGDVDWPIEKIWVALDPLPEVITAAGQNDVDLVITHHPLIFKPIKTVDVHTPVGAVIQQALNCKVAVYSAHTNLDRVQAGVNDVLAAAIGLNHVEPLSVDPVTGQPGFGRIGKIAPPMNPTALIRRLKEALKLERIKVAGDLNSDIQDVVVCSGSGSSMIPGFFRSDADAFISGDLHYHDARLFEFAGKVLIDIGHFASEHLIVEALADRLKQRFRFEGLKCDVEAYAFEKDPFLVV